MLLQFSDEEADAHQVSERQSWGRNHTRQTPTLHLWSIPRCKACERERNGPSAIGVPRRV